MRTGLIERRLELVRVRGRTRAGAPGPLVLAGRGPELELLVRAVLSRDRLSSLPLTGRRRGLAVLAASEELVVAQVPRILTDRLLWPRFPVMPAMVGTNATVAEIQARRRFHSSVRSADVLLQRSGFSVRRSTHEGDFDLFYDGMYVPFASNRFGVEAIVRPREALRRWLRRGSLFWIAQASRHVSGFLAEQEGATLHLLSLGTSLDPAAARRLGLLNAPRLFAADHAAANGAATLDFGGSLRSKHL